jgi:hypothetical protein
MSLSEIKTPQTLLPALLHGALLGGNVVDAPEVLQPTDAAGAYAVQRQLLQQLGKAAGGWKVGAKSADAGAAINGSPLPLRGVHRSGASLERRHFPILWAWSWKLLLAWAVSCSPAMKPCPIKSCWA